MNRILIIFFLIYQVSNSQSVIDFKFHDTCKDSIVNLGYSLYPLFPTDSFDFYESIKDSLITVPSGEYSIYVGVETKDLDYISFSFNKTFRDKKKYNDTINIPRTLIKLRNTGQYAHLFMGYYCCKKLCDGHFTDYHDNGKIKLEGDFKNGLPVKIKKYDENGFLILTETYDEDGNLIDSYNN